MAKENLPRGGNAQPDAPFRHGTTLGEHGEILFDCPIEIRDKEDLDNYGITWDDCRYLHFNGSQRMRVYFFKTENRELAEAQWSYLDTLHSKSFIKCPTTNSCARCPYGRKPEDKQAPVISLDGLLDDGYEPAPAESVEHRVLKKIEYEEIRARMDAEDPRIALAFEGKELYGETVQELATELGVSTPRVYQLIARAREIGRTYHEETM